MRRGAVSWAHMVSGETRLRLKMMIPAAILLGSLFAIVDSFAEFTDMSRRDHALEGMLGMLGIFGSAWVAQIIGHTHWNNP